MTESPLNEPGMRLIPVDLRPKTYAAAELFLDLHYFVSRLAKADCESLAIYVCIAEATMRPVVRNRVLADRIATASVAPEESRGSISMLLIADRLGLPRETVRRKVKKLVASGLAYQDAEGRIRTTPNLDETHVQEAIEGIHAAVGRYRDRLQAFGIET